MLAAMPLLGRHHRLHAMTIAALVCAVTSLAGCSAKENAESTTPDTMAKTTPIVCVSNYPVKYFVERIADGAVEVHFPAHGSGDPAFWHPTPDDILAIQKADLIVLNGAAYEHWLNTVSLPSSRVIDSSAGLTDKLIETKDAITHSHGPEGAHTHSGTAFTTWMDLTMAAEQARAIGGALASRWPDHKAQFESATEKLVADLVEIDANITAAMDGKNDMPVVFSHPVYQYFERRYNANGATVHWEPNEMPADAEWEHLTETLKTHPAKVMFWEATPLPEVANRLEQLGVHSVILNPCGDTPAQGDLKSVMDENVARLKQAYLAG